MLRPYQQACLDAIIKDLDVPGNSICVLPTGAGKSHIIAAAARERNPVLIIQPSQELLKQNLDKLALLVSREHIGIYSASFKKKEIKTFTFATIQSIYKKPELFQEVKLVLLDECHQLSPRNAGMLSSFLAKLPTIKVIGLTATAFRTEMVYENINGDLYAATGIKMINRMYIQGTKRAFWSRILYTISHQSLVDQGYLVPLTYISQPLVPYEEIKINASHSDFNLSSYSASVIGFEANILRTIQEAQNRFRSVLVFCSEVAQAERLADIVIDSEIVTGKTPVKERKDIIERFKDHTTKTVFNVGCLTTGFDHPSLDCVVLLRPVKSPILYLQMLGRLTRPALNKPSATVIDLTGSCKALGPIESFEMFQQNGLWNVRSSKVDGFHGRLLFRQKL
ncbi:MAG: DEAD/DEAH box helicase [Candidatus Pacebacteria bacterium]|nr:DEAD/DEAH box helicase [Candidatus Paceibacterota bacterium]